MKKIINVDLNNIESVKKFCNKTFKFNGKLTLKSDIYVIDAKSIMGIFSLDLSKPIELHIDGENENDVNEFIKNIKEFIVEK